MFGITQITSATGDHIAVIVDESRTLKPYKLNLWSIACWGLTKDGQVVGLAHGCGMELTNVEELENFIGYATASGFNQDGWIPDIEKHFALLAKRRGVKA